MPIRTAYRTCSTSRLTLAVAALLFSIVLGACSRGDRGEVAASPVSLPATLSSCFGEDAPITATGTYALSGVAWGVSRGGRLGEAGARVTIDESADDPLAERLTVIDASVAAANWTALLTGAGAARGWETGCHLLRYTGEPYTVEGDGGCRLRATAIVCPGAPCTVNDGHWNLRCEAGSPKMLATGAWGAP